MLSDDDYSRIVESSTFTERSFAFGVAYACVPGPALYTKKITQKSLRAFEMVYLENGTAVCRALMKMPN